MSRLIFFWSNPQHLRGEEAAASVREQSRRLVAMEGVQASQLTRLRTASPRFAHEGHWMLQVELASEIDGREWVDRDACAAWRLDLRQLGMHPSVALADDD